MRFATSHLLSLAREVATGYHEVGSDVPEVLDAIAERAIREAVEHAKTTCEERGAKRIRAEDFATRPRSERKTDLERYVEWLEEANEAFARALREAGREVPKLPSAPLTRART